MALPLKVELILCPYDFSPSSREGLAMAITVAQAFHCELHVIHVVVTPPPHALSQGNFAGGIRDEEHRLAERLSEELRPKILHDVERLGGAGVEIHAEVREGLHEDLVIREYAELLNADLIVIASHGRRRLARFFLGSTADRVVRAAPCPVLIVRPRFARERDRLIDPEPSES